MSRPRQRLIRAFASDPLPRAITLIRPNSRIAKYSGEENCSAKLATGFVSSTMATAESMPPPKAATSVQPSARAGSPFRAIA